MVGGGVGKKKGARQPLDVYERLRLGDRFSFVDPLLLVAGAHLYTDIGNNTFMVLARSYIACGRFRFGWGRPCGGCRVLAGVFHRRLVAALLPVSP